LGVTSLGVIFFILGLIDAFLVGILVKWLVSFIFGHNKFQRLLNVTLIPIAAIGYFIYSLSLLQREDNSSIEEILWTLGVVFLGPIVIFLVLGAIAYIIGGGSSKNTSS
jgi:fructose-specific phosphotransferase system IIC component